MPIATIYEFAQLKAISATEIVKAIISPQIFFMFQNFLRDLLREASKSQEVTEDKLIEYTDT